MTGTVKNIMEGKDYGFIQGGDGKEYFFHKSCMSYEREFDLLKKGSTVEFDPTDGKKGPRAENVVLL